MPHIALVVDDSMLIRHTISRFLEERGFEVQSATNGVEALQVLRQVHPDLIITDLSMPRMTGQELITKLRLDPETSSIPVLILAGRQSASETRSAPNAEHVIYKDIAMESQLNDAIQAIATSSSTAQ